MVAPPDLDFGHHDTLHGTHGLHAFAAKCPPPLAAWGIAEYSAPGEYVVDPMAGSGTTLVEGRLAGRNVLGIDIDPLASLLSRVKATPLPMADLALVCRDLLEAVRTDCVIWDRLREGASTIEEATSALRLVLPSFRSRDRWFLPEVSSKLAIVKRAIAAVGANGPQRDFLYVAFSSLIVARTSVANARDVVHSRHHHMSHASTPDVPALFAARLARMQRQMVEFVARLPAGFANQQTITYQADARALPVASASADLVFTSPPYCNAIDYPRAHQLAVAWLGDVLGIETAAYAALARTYIGSDRASKALSLDLTSIPGESPTARRVIAEVARVDRVRAAIIQRYFSDMASVLAEIGRVLKPERHAVLVICPSNIRRVRIPSHEIFVELGKRLPTTAGYCLEPVTHYERVIDDRKRLLPYMSHTALAARMRTEYVIVLRKRAQTT